MHAERWAGMHLIPLPHHVALLHPSYTILCHSTTLCSLKVIVVIIGGAKVGFEDVLVVVGEKTVEIDVVELQTFI